MAIMKCTKVVPDFDGISVPIAESPTAPLWLVIDFTGRYWPTLRMNKCDVCKQTGSPGSSR